MDYTDRLLWSCRDERDDDSTRLVWADAVGGERGELVIVQCELARGVASPGRARVLRVREAAVQPTTVTCVIPGHEREGRELVVDELSVETGPLAFAYRGVCAYESTFDYAG